MKTRTCDDDDDDPKHALTSPVCHSLVAATYVLAWKRGIAILTAGNVKVSPDPRVHLSNGYTLQIKDAREQDAGDYICQIATIDPREITHHVEILGTFKCSPPPPPPPSCCAEMQLRIY